MTVRTEPAEPSGEVGQGVTVISPGAPGLVMFDGREAPFQLPAQFNPEQQMVHVRHMGVHFAQNTAPVSAALAAQRTGVSGTLLGSAGPSADFPTSLIKGPGSELGMYMDTQQLETLGYYPFTQAYCKQVGLGAPHFILVQELISTQMRPWAGQNGALTMSVEATMATAVRVGGGNAPIFQISFFAYLTDTRNSKTVAILFNLWDPRGPYGMGVGNDRHVFFYTTGIGATDPAGNDLTRHFTVVEGSHQRSTFAWQPFTIRIDREQLRAMLTLLKGSETGLSLDPADFLLGSVGLLNEMNFLYAPIPPGLTPAQQEPYACIPDHDSAAYAKVGYGLRSFKADVGPAPKTYLGANDGVAANGVVRGWACERDTASPVTVRLTAGGQVLGDVVANRVGEAAIGALCGPSSAHRFEYQPTAAQLAALGGQTVSAAVVGGPVLQTFGWVSYVLPRPVTPPVELTGLLEGVFLRAGNAVTVEGWACARGSAEAVRIDVGGVGSARADQWSEAGVAAACGNAPGPHRFKVALSTQQVVALSGQSASATASDVLGTRQLALPLAGAWPGTVPAFLGGFDGVGSDGTVRGWACAVGRDETVQVTLRAAGAVLATVSAGEAAEAAVGTLCRSGSAHRFTVVLTPAQRSAFRTATVDAEVWSGGGPVYALQKFAGINYGVQ